MPGPMKRKDITPNDPRSKRADRMHSEDQNSALQSATAFLTGWMGSGANNDKPETGRNTFSRGSSTYGSCSNLSSTTSTVAKRNLDRKKLCEAKNYGKFRDFIEIHVLRLNEEPLKTSVNPQLGINICRMVLKLPRDEIHGIDLNWKGHPVIEIRLMNQINIDDLPESFNYSLKRAGDLGDANYYCEISGIRRYQHHLPRHEEEEDPDEPWFRWVSIEGTGYTQKEQVIKTWLQKYGEILSDFEEEKITVVDPDPEDGESLEFEVGSGRFKVKMKILNHIPQFLPMNGRKVRIYYRGMIKLCANCFEPNHLKSECSNEKKPWIEYVADFLEENDDMGPELFGRWVQAVKKYRLNLTGTSSQTVIQSNKPQITQNACTNTTRKNTTQQESDPSQASCTTRTSERVRTKTKPKQ